MSRRRKRCCATQGRTGRQNHAARTSHRAGEGNTAIGQRAGRNEAGKTRICCTYKASRPGDSRRKRSASIDKRCRRDRDIATEAARAGCYAGIRREARTADLQNARGKNIDTDR